MIRKTIVYIVTAVKKGGGGEYSDFTRHFSNEEAARRWIETLPDGMYPSRFFKRTSIIEDEELSW